MSSDLIDSLVQFSASESRKNRVLDIAPGQRLCLDFEAHYFLMTLLVECQSEDHALESARLLLPQLDLRGGSETPISVGLYKRCILVASRLEFHRCSPIEIECVVERLRALVSGLTLRQPR